MPPARTTVIKLPSYHSFLPIPTGEASASRSEIGSEPPIYSTQPNSDEETVAYTPRHSDARGPDSPEGSYVKKWRLATLVLKYQEPDTRQPRYGRNGKVEGELSLNKPERVTHVSVKFTGQISFTASDSTTMDLRLCALSESLWRRDQDVASNQPPRCPSILPICLSIPSTYTWEGNEYRMPPSYEFTLLNLPAMFVRVQYVLYISISRSRFWNRSWISTKTYATLINYHPRNRPVRPIVMLQSVVSSIKPHPEEWTQIITRMTPRPKFGRARPIECQVFIPSVQTYGINDAIPFHIQLTSTLASLRELLPANSPQLKPVDHRRSTFKMPKLESIQITIARQIVVEINKQRKFRFFTVGQGTMWPVPPLPPLVMQGSARVDYTASASGAGPSASSKGPGIPTAMYNEVDGRSSVMSLSMRPKDIYSDARDDDHPDTEYCLDWQGELRCWDEVSTGGFATSHLYVKDFLHISLTLPNPRSSFLAPLQLSHPIRLVTDTWMEDVHPSDR